MKCNLGIVVLSVRAGGWVLSYANEEAHAEAESVAEGEGHGEAGHKESASEYILHHVADDEKWELDIPVPPYHALTLNVGSWFSALKFEREPGACAKTPSPAWSAFPSLGLFLDGCWDLRPTKAILMLWLASGLLFAFVWLGRRRDQHGVPKGLVSHLVEVLALFVRDEIAIPNIGKAEGPRYTPYLTSLFFFILFVDWLGLIPGLFAGTSVIAVTAALALISFAMTQIAGIRAAGLGGYFKHLTGGVGPCRG